ncbi:hypothetical protein LCGC14_1238680 [marine sediment metagenome]|uniref:Uncharacterized protein n=1 Tax=marine sediment metagenome TaxID=412755 RepID=A0A0F9LAK3_9ZZZZ
MIKQILRTAWKDFIAHLRPSSYAFDDWVDLGLCTKDFVSFYDCEDCKEQRTGDEVV